MRSFFALCAAAMFFADGAIAAERPATAAGAEAEFTPIFNGKDLPGWEGKPKWRVEDGAITCDKPCASRGDGSHVRFTASRRLASQGTRGREPWRS